ncbi:MAG: 50S ribosomal protein L37ae [Candidatus Woesearchaeota archaeon]
MAIDKKHVKGIKRFGARYGKKVRDRLSKIEAIIKTKHKCPYCHYNNVKRVSNGIFECKKCSSKFSGKAYMPMKQKISKKVSKEKIVFEDELFSKKPKMKKEENYDENIESNTDTIIDEEVNK